MSQTIEIEQRESGRSKKGFTSKLNTFVFPLSFDKTFSFFDIVLILKPNIQTIHFIWSSKHSNRCYALHSDKTSRKSQITAKQTVPETLRCLRVYICVWRALIDTQDFDFRLFSVFYVLSDPSSTDALIHLHPLIKAVTRSNTNCFSILFRNIT